MRKKNRLNWLSGFYKATIFLIIFILIEFYSGYFLTDGVFKIRGKILETSNGVSDYFRDFRYLERENSLLRDSSIQMAKDLAEYKYFRSRYETLFEENVHLKKLLKIRTSIKKPIFTRPLRVFNQVHNRSVRAEKPEQTVQIGMLVLNEDGIVIGRVSSLSTHSFLLYLLNDKRSALPVVVSDKNINAVAIGNGHDIDLMHIPMDSGIKQGDVVRTLQTKSGGVDYQMIGRVAHVQSSPDKSFLIAKVSQVDNFRSLQWLILLPNS